MRWSCWLLVVASACGDDGGSSLADANGVGDGGDRDGGVVVPPAGPSRFAAGKDSACAIDAQGALRCWGAGYGTARTIAAGSTFIDVASSMFVDSYVSYYVHQCAIRSDGALACWRTWDDVSPLLDDTTSYKKVAITPQAKPCAVATSGALYCWNTEGTNRLQIGTDTDWDYVTGGSTAACALKTSGALYCWGSAGHVGTADGSAAQDPVEIVPGSTWRDVGAGSGSVCGTKTDGTLHCWGQLGEGGKGPAPIGTASSWARVSVGYLHACALTTIGTMHCWGLNQFGEAGQNVAEIAVAMPTQVGTDSDWVHVSAGGLFSCGAKQNGTLACWGTDGIGQLGRGTNHTSPAMIATGATQLASNANMICGLFGGALSCWGSRPQFVYPNGHPIMAVPEPRTLGATWSQIAVGLASTDTFACAIASDRSVACWGDNSEGKVGAGPGSAFTTPTPIGIFASRVALGWKHACAVHVDGSLYCWGGREGTALGNDTNVPTKIGTDTWIDVTAGLDDSCGVKSDNTLWCWGAGWTAQQQIRPDLRFTRIVASGSGPFRYGITTTGTLIAFNRYNQSSRLQWSGTWRTVAESGHLCGIRTDGTLACAGTNIYGQVGDGTIAFERLAMTQIGTATDWQSIALAYGTTCASRSTGDVYCWGNNTYGEVGDGTAYSVAPATVLP